jgi:hypothetical protein
VGVCVVYAKPDDVTERDWTMYLARHQDGVSASGLARTHGIRPRRVLTICRRVVFKMAEGFLATHSPDEALRVAEQQVPIGDAYRDEWLWSRQQRDA